MSTSLQDNEAALQLAASPETKLAALNNLSEALCEVDPKRALSLSDEAYALARVLSDSERAVVALLNRAWAQFNLADYGNSILSVQDGLRQARSAHLDRQEFDALTILGNNYNIIGNRAEALQCFTDTLTISKKLDNPRRVATALSSIGQQYAESGDFEQALDHYSQALTTMREFTSYPIILANILLNVSDMHNRLGNYKQAISCATEALETAQSARYASGEALALMYNGNIHRNMQDVVAAMTFYDLALTRIRATNTPFFEGMVRKEMAGLLLETNNTAKALQYLHEALALFQAQDAKPQIFEIHQQLAMAYQQVGDYASAFDQLQRFHDVKELVFNEQADNRQKTLQALYEVEKARLEAETQYNRNLTLQSEVQQSEQVISELDAYADNVAHDLRNPIGVIIGFGELLKMNLEDTLDAENLSYLTNVLAAADKMNEIVEALLTLARARKQEILPQVVDMESVLNEALQRIQTMVTQHGVTIERQGTLPSAMGNAAWLEEAFVNYIGNGIKYGGMPPHIVIGATEQEDGLIRYWVHDNGQGLSAEAKALLFRKFERLGQYKIDGHGLGLTIVKSIVEKLGGSVQVESSGIPGEGSTFSFTLRVPNDDVFDTLM